MPKKRAIYIVVAVIAIIGALSQVLPTYNYVHMSGPDGTVEVERAGFGPQNVEAKSSTGSVRSSSR